METDWAQDEPIILWIPEAQGIEENEMDSRYWSLPLPNIEMSLYIGTLDVTLVQLQYRGLWPRFQFFKLFLRFIEIWKNRMKINKDINDWNAVK